MGELAMMRVDALPRSMLSGAAPRASLGWPRLGPPSDALVALVIVALLPALFWVGLIGGLAAMSGMTVPPSLLLALGMAIAAFLSMIGGALLSGRS